LTLNQIGEVARMDTDPRVSELLLDWQELRQKGQTVTAAELCADCPELAKELERRMATVDYWEQFLGTRDDQETALNQTVDETGPEPDPPVSPVSTPTHIGRYRIEGLLGRGGFGLVYKAHDEQLQRLVAIKVPHPERVERPEDAEAYLTEARTVANLDHPN